MPSSTVFPDAEADINAVKPSSLHCRSVQKAYRSIATLREETAPGKAGHRLLSPQRTDSPRSKAPALIREKRCAISSRLPSPKGPLSNRQLIAPSSPPGPQGR